MRHTAAEKLEAIRLVEGSDLPVCRTLRELGVSRSTFYGWHQRYLADGPAGLEPKAAAARRYWTAALPRCRGNDGKLAVLEVGTALLDNLTSSTATWPKSPARRTISEVRLRAFLRPNGERFLIAEQRQSRVEEGTLNVIVNWPLLLEE